MRLWWVRHAPVAARPGAIGWSDPPADLSDRAALARLRACLPAAPLVTSSDLGRARQTRAALFGATAGLPPDPALRELHFGRWEGRGFDDIAREDPAAARAFWDDPGPARAPGGESWDDLQGRVAGRMADWAAAPPAGDVVIVAHAGPIRAALAEALGLGADRAFAFRVDPLSVTVIERLGGHWAVDRVNHRP